MLSIVIPSYKDPFLNKTINDLLNKSRGVVEVIVILDGYWPTTKIIEDDRVRIVHQGTNLGMRESINNGVKIARYPFIMRVDEHQMFGEGYDVKLTEIFEDDWIVTPRRYFLDVDKWETMDLEPVDYEKLIIDKKYPKFAAVRWNRKGREKFLIDEKYGMQGSCWVMKKSWWDKVIVELESEGYGTLYQDSVEMLFKTWKAGGKLMLNKRTWHAHKHRKFKRTHNYPGDLSRKSWEYALKTWEEDYRGISKGWQI